MQGRSFTGLDQVLRRDSRTDIFREIQILKNTNDDLLDEVNSLESQLNKMSGQEDALKAVASDINKYKLISGEVTVKGQGIQLALEGNIKSLWLTDIVNELLSAGAEAVSINGIRITNSTAGFDTIPNGQILLNSVILKSPYLIEAIGDKKVLNDALIQPQGIVQRIRENLPGVNVAITQKDEIRVEKII
jgi:uncharacterized protein YlxW (UPF0749 family)